MAEKLAELKQKGGSGGSLTETTLWTNSSPTSAFAAQTVTLAQNFNNFNSIRIYYKYSKTSSDVYYIDFPVDMLVATAVSGYNPVATLGSLINGSSYIRTIVWPGDTSVSISTAYRINQSGNDTSYGIPTKICGVK